MPVPYDSMNRRYKFSCLVKSAVYISCVEIYILYVLNTRNYNVTIFVVERFSQHSLAPLINCLWQR